MTTNLSALARESVRRYERMVVGIAKELTSGRAGGQRTRSGTATRRSHLHHGLVLQELLQGFSGSNARESILEKFSPLPLLAPDRRDHVAAAELRNTCRRGGVQIGTIDALIAQLCVRYASRLLTTDQDFVAAARLVPIKLWHA